MVVIMETYINCMDCPNHIVEADPDPHDWFCDDDQAVLCTLAKNINNQHRWCDNRVWVHRPITWSCRPHHKRADCVTPEWRPLLHKEEPATCICEGNFRNIIKETGGLIGKDFKDANNRTWEFAGVLWASDDFYYVFELESYDADITRYCSCIVSIEQHGFKLVE